MLDKYIVALIGLMIFFKSSFFDGNLIPAINIGGTGSLGIYDIVFLFLTLVAIVKFTTVHNKALKYTVYNKLYLMFILLGIVGVINAVYTGTGFHLAAKEARDFFLYLIYFYILLLGCNEKNILKLTKYIVVLGVITSIFSVLQAVAGDRIAFLFGKVITLRTAGSEVEGVTRVASGGLATINLAFFICLASLTKSIKRKTLVAFLILAVGVFISFNRGTWLSIILALIALLPFVEGKVRLKFIKVFSVISIIAVLIITASYSGALGTKLSRYGDAVVERFISFLPSNLKDDGSTMDRVAETEIVFNKFKSRPVFGHGIGAITQENVGPEQVSWGYVHNGYMYILFKLGITGLVVFLLFYLLFVYRAVLGFKKIAEPKFKSIYLGSLLFLISIIPHSIASPRIMEGKYIVIITIAMGLIELIRYYSMSHLHDNDDNSNRANADDLFSKKIGFSQPKLR